MLQQKLLDDKLSFNLKSDLKKHLKLQAEELGISLAQYARSILAQGNEISVESQEQISLLQQEVEVLNSENERLSLLTEKVSEKCGDFTVEEVDELCDNYDAEIAELRAAVSAGGVGQISVISEEEKEAYEEEITKLESQLSEFGEEHQKIVDGLFDEINAAYSKEQMDELHEMYAEELATLSATLSTKDSVIEELRQSILGLDQSDKSHEETNEQKSLALTSADDKIAELEKELEIASNRISYDQQMYDETSGELRRLKREFKVLNQSKSDFEKKALESAQLTEDLQERETTLEMQSETIEQLRSDLEKITLQSRQQLTEQEEDAHSKELLLKKIVKLQEELENAEELSDGFAENANVALDKWQQEMTVSKEVKVQCGEQEELIAKQQVKINQFIEMINELQGKLRVLKTSPTPDDSSVLQIEEVTADESKMYEDCITFLKIKHSKASTKNLVLASLYNAYENKKAILVSVPYSSSLRKIEKNFRA